MEHLWVAASGNLRLTLQWSSSFVELFMLIKGELHSNKFVLYFALIGMEQDSITVYKMIFFNSKTLTFQYHLHKALFTNMNMF